MACVLLLSLFSLSQLNNVRILINDKNNSNLMAEAELLFVKRFSEFERSFIVFSRSFKKANDNISFVSTIGSKFEFLDFVQLFDLKTQKFIQPEIFNKQQLSPNGQINIAQNPALFTMLETSKIYGIRPIYGPIFSINEERYIPTSIYLDHLISEELIILGFINLNKFEKQISTNSPFIYRVSANEKIGKLDQSNTKTNSFLFNELNKNIFAKPKDKTSINAGFFRDLIIVLPIMISLFLLVGMLWNETFQRKKMEKKLSKQILLAEQNSRLVFLGEMIASIAHELNQPLAAISLYSSSLQKR